MNDHDDPLARVAEREAELDHRRRSVDAVRAANGMRLALIGFFIQICSPLLGRFYEAPTPLQFVARLGYWVGAIVVLAGCFEYLRGRGRHPALALLGLWPLVGILLVLTLRERRA